MTKVFAKQCVTLPIGLIGLAKITLYFIGLLFKHEKIASLFNMFYHYDIRYMKNAFVKFDDLVITDVQPAGIACRKRKSRVVVDMRQSYGISIKTDGETTYNYNNQLYKSNSHNIMILKKGASYRFTVNEYGPCYVINFEILNGELDFESIEINDVEPYITLSKEIFSLFNSNERGWKLIIKQKFYELLVLLANDKKLSKNPTSNKINPALKFIDEHLDQKISNGELAKMCLISEIYLRKLFIQITGSSPQQYIIDKKIKTAVSWLLTTNIAVNEIAAKLGFSDIYSFSKSFKLHTGSSPLQYRKAKGVY